jgi:hypothetical protein
MFRRLTHLVRPSHSVNVVSPAAKTAAMPAEQNGVGSDDPVTKGERFSTTSVASIGRRIQQPLQSVAMDPICLVAADTPHGAVSSYLNRNLRAATRVNCPCKSWGTHS